MKKKIIIISLILIGILLFYESSKISSVVSPNLGDVSNSITGDVNNDGKVNSMDYILVRKHILGVSKLSGDSLSKADTNNDGKVNSMDYITIKKIILGISNNNNNNNNSSYVKPEKTGFEITYYWGIPADRLTDSHIDDMKAAGITIAHLRTNPDGINDTVRYRENMDKAIKKLKAKGLKVMVVDNYTLINRMKDYQTDEEALEKVADMVNFYSKYSNVIGYEIMDEPSTAYYGRLAKIVNYIRKNDPERVAYINLFPNYAGASQLGTSSYRDYIYSFANTVNPQILSVDHYSSMFAGKSISASKDELYTNAIYMTDIYNTKGIKPMIISLLSKHLSFKDLTPNEIAFQISVNLAFGMKRLSYFTYSIDVFDASNAMVDNNYNRTTHYYDVKSINAWAKNIGKELYSKRVKAIYGINEVPTLTNYNSNKFLGEITVKRVDSGVPAPAIVSVFDDNTMLLVNTDFTTEQSIFTFDGVNTKMYNMQWFNPYSGKWTDISYGGEGNIWLMPDSERLAIVPGNCILLRKK